MSDKKPLAFMSYAHADNEDGKLSEFRRCLEREVSLQLGKKFEIFQDREHIKWGELWASRIKESIDSTVFLIPVITPSFFNSEPCREELIQFQKREENLRREDLILPVYYRTSPLMNDAEKRAANAVASTMASHQYADWRPLRLKSFKSVGVKEALEKLGNRICETLAQSPFANDITPFDDADIVALLRRFFDSTRDDYKPFVVAFNEADTTCGFPRGTTKDIAEKVAELADYTVIRVGAQTIELQKKSPSFSWS